jgi:hypothetical protein
MEKYLVFLLVFSMAIFGCINVSADIQNQTQNLTVDIPQVINVAITPSSLNFGSVIPGTNNVLPINNPISFNATGSNVDLVIITASVSGLPFETGLRINGASPASLNLPINCTKVANICNYELKQQSASLDVPVGFTAGTANGVITYTITGSIPL